MTASGVDLAAVKARVEAATEGPWKSAEQTHGEWFGIQDDWSALREGIAAEVLGPVDGWREGDAVVVRYDDGGPNAIGTWTRRRQSWASGTGLYLPWTPDGEAVDTFFAEGRVVYVHAPRAALSAPVQAAEEVARCDGCRHAPHDSLGFCPNMASDNDCSCKGSSAAEEES